MAELAERPTTVMQRVLSFMGEPVGDDATWPAKYRHPARPEYAVAAERAQQSARPPPHPRFALGLPWNLVRVPQLFDAESVAQIVDAFDAAVANLSYVQFCVGDKE